ncbi:MAG: hypothetical protein QXS24_05270 [Desulfurococcaceae archaeon]
MRFSSTRLLVLMLFIHGLVLCVFNNDSTYFLISLLLIAIVVYVARTVKKHAVSR